MFKIGDTNKNKALCDTTKTKLKYLFVYLNERIQTELRREESADEAELVMAGGRRLGDPPFLLAHETLSAACRRYLLNMSV